MFVSSGFPELGGGKIQRGVGVVTKKKKKKSSSRWQQNYLTERKKV